MKYHTIESAASAYEPVLTPRLLRRLVQQRRIAFTRAGRRIVLAENDIEHYLEQNRVEPVVARSAYARRITRTSGRT